MTFFLEPKGKVIYEVVGVSEGVVHFKEEFEAIGLPEAKAMAERTIGEFFSTAFEAWFGRNADSRCPIGEIRIRQISPATQNTSSVRGGCVWGVGEDGKLYYFNGYDWEPQPMKLIKDRG